MHSLTSNLTFWFGIWVSTISVIVFKNSKNIQIYPNEDIALRNFCSCNSSFNLSGDVFLIILAWLQWKLHHLRFLQMKYLHKWFLTVFFLLDLALRLQSPPPLLFLLLRIHFQLETDFSLDLVLSSTSISTSTSQGSSSTALIILFLCSATWSFCFWGASLNCLLISVRYSFLREP